ncbi:MAG: hypothetical protein ABR517_11220 [Thermoanaerobaculia bacterium]
MSSRRFLLFFAFLAVAGLSLLGSSRVVDEVPDRGEADKSRFDIRIEVMPWSEYRGPKFLEYPPREGFMCKAVVSAAGTNRAYFIERLPLYAGRSQTKSRVVEGMTFTAKARVSEDGRDLRASVVITKDESGSGEFRFEGEGAEDESSATVIGRYSSITRLPEARF